MHDDCDDCDDGDDKIYEVNGRDEIRFVNMMNALLGNKSFFYLFHFYQ